MNECWIGIDVAKAQLDLVEVPTGRHWSVPNTAAGWAQLCATIPADSLAGIVVEATGPYHVGVTLALAATGVTPIVVNPLTLRRFAQSLGRRAKTDRLDAEILARYGAQVRPVARPVPAETARQLQELLSRHQQLTKMLTSEKNRRHDASAVLQPSLDAHIAHLTAQRQQIDALLAAIVASDPYWAGRVAQLQSVPGIGALTATTLAVGVPELGEATRQEVAALVGVAPYACDSGTMRGQRHIAGGRRVMRQALYQVLTSALRCNLVLATHYRRLRARHKPHKVAMVASMRRLLGLLTAMVRDGLRWEELRVVQAFAPPLSP